MKALRTAEDIVPLGQFKTQAASVLRKLNSHCRPIVITQNGKAAGVLLAPNEFDRLVSHQRFIEAVQEGLADSEAGRVIDDEELGRELDERFGPLE